MKFDVQVAKNAIRYKQRLIDARNHTVLGIINQAQTTKASGGRLPFKTGYLRRSIRAALGGVPSESSGSPLSVLMNARLGANIHVGWHADYAWFQEIKNGFMRGALADAQRHADNAARKVR